jgi:hypothetical protein
MNEHDETRNDETSLYDDLYATDVTDPPAEPDESAAASWRHPVNIGHLVMGVAFTGMVIVWAIFAGGAIADDNIGWLMGVPWVLAGAAGLVAMAVSARRRSRPVA